VPLAEDHARAWAAKRANASYYKAQFFRLNTRRGAKKNAICTVAASILTAIHHMLKDGTFHQDLGAAYFDRRSPEAKVKSLARQIARLDMT
jgi:transposase